MHNVWEKSVFLILWTDLRSEELDVNFIDEKNKN